MNDAVSPSAVRAAHALRRLLLGRTGGGPDARRKQLMCSAPRCCDAMAEGRNPAAGWLTPARLATVERLVAERMEQRDRGRGPRSGTWAVGGLPHPGFHGALGTTPHRHLLERRLARARTKLAATGKPIGGGSRGVRLRGPGAPDAHMRAAFGVTPAAYRWQRHR